MSENFRASVRTILSRIESHPEEFREQFGKWEDVQNAVADRVGGERNRLRGLTDEEIEAIYNKLKEHVWGPQFDEHVMTKVLDPEKEEREQGVYKISVGSGGGGGILKPGEIYAVTAGGQTYPDRVTRQKAELHKIYEEQRRQHAEQLGLGSFLKRTINKIKL